MFKLDIENVLAYDDIRRKVKYIKKCDECGNFEEVIGANPVFLKNPELFVGDLYKTDLAFGTGNRKEVLYLCSVRIAEILRKLKLRGLSLEPIEA